MKLPSTLIIIVSTFSRPDLVRESVEAGAMGYVTKVSTPETLLQCIHAVVNGQLFVDGEVSQGLSCTQVFPRRTTCSGCTFQFRGSGRLTRR